ncbi:hypothetical protein [Pararhizobium arenae]|uniref:hypothetical protein n=1 Tax=Pararhizobium arenae TaxID=1856850 RepID=UPI00094B55E1|nr:hypothetical protein [Pararhizobium arenae]
MPFLLRRAVIIATLLTAPGLAQASSGDAWEEMRADVSKKCLAAVASSMESPKAVVDPFGSERFGLALVSGKAKGAEATISQICVYDKQAKTVELGSELTEEMLKD